MKLGQFEATVKDIKWILSCINHALLFDFVVSLKWVACASVPQLLLDVSLANVYGHFVCGGGRGG